MKYITIVAALLMIFSCKTNKEIGTDKSFNEDELIMYLAKGICFGRCPTYQLSIYGNGMAQFNGERFTDKLGKYEKQLDKQTFSNLKQAFATSNFETFEREIPSRLPDLPLITLGYKVADTLQLSSGKERRPESHVALEELLNEVAESDGWILLEAANVDGMEEGEQSNVQIDKSRIVISIDGVVKLPTWFKTMRDNYGVRILERMDDEKKLWLITYDQDMVSGDMLLKELRKDSNIGLAEYEAKFKNQ